MANVPPAIDLERMRQISWWHRIDLGQGIVTPGAVDMQERLRDAGLPADLSGKSVLDIGAWDGFFSFEAEKRGARHVMALDHVVWNEPRFGRRGFDFAHAALRSRVATVDCDVYDLSPAKVGDTTYDLVLFLGVLYHIQDPLWVLHRVASVTRDMMILETHVDMTRADRPVMAYYPGKECALDSSNWWGPNRACVEAMLGTVGFRKVELFSTSIPVGYGIDGEPDPQNFGRMVWHAWK